MLTLFAILHVIIGIGLIAFVLLQDPKDGAAGIFGGGSSSKTFFGASGAANFLSTATKWLAGLFAVSCLLLTVLTTKHSTSVLDEGGAVPPATAPAPADGAAAPASPNAPATPPAEQQAPAPTGK